MEAGGATGEINTYEPEATVQELQETSLEELLQNERLGRLDQTGHLLMGLDQEAADFVVVTERRANVPSGVDYAHDVLHRLALRVIEESYGAERYGCGPVIRWAATTAALEFRDAGRQLLRLADLITDNLVRDPSEPRTAPPGSSIMYQHYRAWALRWRGGFGQIIQGVMDHHDDDHRRQQAEMQGREEHERRLQELRELQQLRVPLPTGPEAGLGVPVAKRPVGVQAGFRRESRSAADIASGPSSSGDTLASMSTFLTNMGETTNTGGTTSSSMTSAGLPPHARAPLGSTGPASSTLGASGMSSPTVPPRPKFRMPTTPIMQPPSTPTQPLLANPHPLDMAPCTPDLPEGGTQTPDPRPPGMRSARARRARPYDMPEHPLHLIPSAPTRHYGFTTPFDEYGQPCTPVIPATPKHGPGVPHTPLGDDDVDEVLADILGSSAASTSSTTSTTTTPSTTSLGAVPTTSTLCTTSLSTVHWPVFGHLAWSYANTTSTTSVMDASESDLVGGLDEEVDFGMEEDDEFDEEENVNDETGANQDREEKNDMVEVELDDVDGATREELPNATLEDLEDTGAGVGRILDEALLTPHEQRLAVYVARMVVAEMYHLLRSSGAIPGPSTTLPVDARVTPPRVLRHGGSVPPWHRSSGLPAPRLSPYERPSSSRRPGSFRAVGSPWTTSRTMTSTTTSTTCLPSTTSMTSTWTTCTSSGWLSLSTSSTSSASSILQLGSSATTVTTSSL